MNTWSEPPDISMYSDRDRRRWCSMLARSNCFGQNIYEKMVQKNDVSKTMFQDLCFPYPCCSASRKKSEWVIELPYTLASQLICDCSLGSLGPVELWLGSVREMNIYWKLYLNYRGCLPVLGACSRLLWIFLLVWKEGEGRAHGKHWTIYHRACWSIT